MSALAELLARQQRAIDKHDAAALARLAPVFEQARADLDERLAGLVNRNKGDAYTAAHLKATMVQLEGALLQTGQKLGTITNESAISAMKDSLAHNTEQAELALGKGPFGAPRGIDLATAAQVTAPGSTLIERHAAGGTKWSQDSIKRARAALATHTLAGSTVEETIEDLTKPGGIYDGQRYAAKRFLMTEVSHARNATFLADIKARAARGGRVIKKRLTNIIDIRTAADTLAIIRLPGNLVKFPDEPFQDPVNGRTFQHPPNRPNDRAVLVMDFDTPADQALAAKEIEKADKADAARQAELSRPAAAKTESKPAPRKPAKKASASPKEPAAPEVTPFAPVTITEATPAPGEPIPAPAPSPAAADQALRSPIVPKPTDPPATPPDLVAKSLPQLPPETLPAERLRQNIAAAEEAIRPLPREHAAAFSQDGKLILEKSGEPDKVQFTPAEMLRMRGATVTHSHPPGGTLSTDDLAFAIRRDVAEMRAIGFEQGAAVTYSLVRPETGWISRQTIEVLNPKTADLDDFISALMERLSGYYGKDYETVLLAEMEKAGIIGKTQKIKAAAWHLSIDKLARDLGYTYTREGKM